MVSTCTGKAPNLNYFFLLGFRNPQSARNAVTSRNDNNDHCSEHHVVHVPIVFNIHHCGRGHRHHAKSVEEKRRLAFLQHVRSRRHLLVLHDDVVRANTDGVGRRNNVVELLRVHVRVILGESVRHLPQPIHHGQLPVQLQNHFDARQVLRHHRQRVHRHVQCHVHLHRRR